MRATTAWGPPSPPQLARPAASYDPSRPQFDVVTAVEMGDLDRGYRAIDISGKDERLYSLTCPLMLAMILVAINWRLCPKTRTVSPSSRRSKRSTTLAVTRPICCPRRGTMDQESIDTLTEQGTVQEIKEWQAIMDHLSTLPVESPGELPMIPVDARAAEVRAIKAG